MHTIGTKHAGQLGIVEGEAGDAGGPATLSGASGKRASVREHEGRDGTGREHRRQLVRESGPGVRGREQEEAGPGLLRVDKGCFGFSAHGGLKMGRIPKMSNVPGSTPGDPEPVTPPAYGGM
jgi:hypothetical protein